MQHTVYPKKYAHGFVVLCFVVVMQSFIMNSHEVFVHIHQGCFAGTGAIVRLPQCQWSKPDGYGKISQCITTAKHSKAKTVCIFLGIYCIFHVIYWISCYMCRDICFQRIRLCINGCQVCRINDPRCMHICCGTDAVYDIQHRAVIFMSQQPRFPWENVMFFNLVSQNN